MIYPVVGWLRAIIKSPTSHRLLTPEFLSVTSSNVGNGKIYASYAITHLTSGKTNIMLPKRLLLATPMLLLATVAKAEPRISRVRFHLPGDEAPVTSFRPSVPRIHVIAQLSNATAGMQVKMLWIAVDTQDRPRNVRLADQTLNITDQRIDTLRGNVGLNGNPWPVGEYRLDFLMLDLDVTSATFRVTA